MEHQDTRLTPSKSGCEGGHPISPLTYYPDEDGNSGHTNNDQTESFFLRNFVSIYGGFSTSDSGPDDRSMQLVSVLSGDLTSNDDVEDFLDWDFSSYADNSHHVVQGWGTNATARHSPRFPVSALS